MPSVKCNSICQTGVISGLSALVLFVLLILLPSVSEAANPAVKQSSSGLCHPMGSSYYDRTKNYTAYDSLESCLSAGGRLPKGVSINVNSNTRLVGGGNYERSAFGHGWQDFDGDCQDGRAEALIALSTAPVRFASDDRCRVVSGRWISPFTGEVIQDASAMDADHVYPLKHAWDRGAADWSQEKREKFANDLLNIWPVEASLNRSKGAKGPVDWLPPSGQCQYVARFVRVGMTYGLTPTPDEATAYRRMLDNCKANGRVGG